MREFHFGYQPNTFQCSCGKHYGCGQITPELRAARAKRMQDTMPSLMPEVMKQFLADFERYHGTVRYTMQEVGLSSGEYTPKGTPVIGAVYDYGSDQSKRKAA